MSDDAKMPGAAQIDPRALAPVPRIETERLVLRDLSYEPEAVAFLPDGRVIVAASDRVAVHSWDGAGHVLVRSGVFSLPSGATFHGLVSHRPRAGAEPGVEGVGPVVLAVWRGAAGFGAALYDAAALGEGAVPQATFALAATLGDPAGVVDLEDGPAVLFARSELGRPALMTLAALRGASPPLPAVADRPLLSRSTADGRFVIWTDGGGGEHVVRVLAYDPVEGLTNWASYQLEARSAGPATDPSGEWLYIPVPKLDALVVTQ